MNIQFQCLCGKKLSFHPREAGQTFYCPRCEKKVTVPLTTEATSPKKVEKKSAPADTKAKPTPSASGKTTAPPVMTPAQKEAARRKAEQAKGLPPVVQGFKPKRAEPEFIDQRPPRKPLFQMWRESFLFPLRDDGKWTILVWVGLYGLLHAFLRYCPRLMMYPVIASSFILKTALFVLLVLTPALMLVLVAFLAHYFLQVLRSAAAGEPQMPRVNDGDSLVRDLVLWLAVAIVGLVPLQVLVVSQWGQEIRILGIPFLGSVAWAVFYTPMALLAVTLFDSLLALNPVFVLGAIFRVPVEYLLTSIVVWLVVIAELALILFMPTVPVLTQFLQWGIGLYGCMVSMHLLGTIAWNRRDELAWFRTEPI